MSNQQNDALNAYAAAAELSYLRTDNGIAFAAMLAEAFVEQVETELALIEHPTDEDCTEAVRRVTRDRILEEVATWGLDWQYAVTRCLLDDIGKEAENRIGAPAFGATSLAQSAVESLQQFIVSQSAEAAA